VRIPEDMYTSEEDVIVKKTKGYNSGTFMRCKPPSFDGTQDVAVAQQWIREMEVVITISKCRDDQAIKFAAHSSVDEALCWWDNIRQSLGERAIQRISWKELNCLVMENYCPSSH
jgi:hypothetical protein